MMADRETADRKRGTPQGSPSFTFQPRKAFVGDRSRHQLDDGGAALAPETRDGLPAQVGQLGEGQTEHACRVQHSGIGDCQALPGGVGEGSGQQLLAGSVAYGRDQVQRVRGVDTPGAMTPLAGLECSQTCADPRQQVTGGIGVPRPRSHGDLLPEARDGVGEEGVEVAPRTLGYVEALGQGEAAGDELIDIRTPQHRGDHRGCLVAGQPGGRGRQGGNQFGEVVDAESVDRRRTASQTMTCSPRCGSSPKGLPFSSELSDRGGVHVRHNEDGDSSNLSSNPSSPEKTQKIFADRQSGASDGLWSGGWLNPQVGGLITSVMSPIITSRQASRNRPTERPPWTPEAASPQVGGLITLARGVHHARTASTPADLSTMNRTTTPRPNRSLSPSARITPVKPTAAERRPECPTAHGAGGHSPSPSWWGRHMACPQRQRADGIANAGSHCLRHGCVITASPPRAKTEALRRAHRAHSPIALRSNHEPLMTLALGVHDSGSKIDVQYYWTWRPRRWPTPWACPRDGLGFAALGEKA